MKKYLKFIIGAALVAVLWLSVGACSKKEPVKIEPPKVEQPYTVTKTDTKVAPVVKHKHHKPVHKAKPSPHKREACAVLGIFPVDC